MVIGGLREKVTKDLEETKHQLSPEFALRRHYLNNKTRVKMTSMLNVVEVRFIRWMVLRDEAVEAYGGWV